MFKIGRPGCAGCRSLPPDALGPRRASGPGFAAIFLLACGIAGLAGCGGGGPSTFAGVSERELTFVSAAQTWDLDKDNVVTCAEWTTYTADLFRLADKDLDGMVDAEEYRHIVKEDRLFETAGFAFFDGNADGRLTLAEFTGRENPAFTRLDRDKDCRIAGDESVQTRQATSVSGASGAPSTVPGGGPGGIGR